MITQKKNRIKIKTIAAFSSKTPFSGADTALPPTTTMHTSFMIAKK
ncbi:hypothetical protein [Mucilaginibacter sp. FT3.2]|nr:hypothetical protein [Mucilaginibacter sp. FT3.2]MBB6230655.1 hypothetical protein [Mucilaginibacter sp. FT3.2]